MIETPAAHQIIEGTWEEISHYASRLAGKRVRLLVLDGGDPPISNRQPFHQTATPEEWSQAFREWSNSHSPRNAPPLSDEAISRETIYGDRD